jgi:hypothetical protein
MVRRHVRARACADIQLAFVVVPMADRVVAWMAAR